MIKIETTITAGLIQVFTGLTHSYFQRLANCLAPRWEKAERIRLLSKDRIRGIGGGSKYKLNTIEAKLFFYLLYCRHYVNQRVIAGLCNLDQSNISRLFERIEKLIAQAADPQLKTFLENIKDKREAEGLSFAELKMLYPEIEKVITDVTEIRCNRPKDKERRKNKTSGKKKQYSLKKQVSITKNNRIIGISKTYPGKVHDFNIEKQEAMIGNLPQETYQPVDLGYIGINKLHPEHYVITPPKRANNCELNALSRELKKAHSRQRIPIEHVFASLKKFNILKNYRGQDDRFDNVFDNIAAINNLCLGLA
jgi:hypothetical protein